MRYMRKSKRRKERIKKIGILLIVALVAMVAWKASEIYYGKINLSKLENMERPEWIDDQIIDVDGASRSGEKLGSVKDIVIHYVGNPGSTAQQNHDFYAGNQSNVSSHFVVGLDGEVIHMLILSLFSCHLFSFIFISCYNCMPFAFFVNIFHHFQLLLQLSVRYYVHYAQFFLIKNVSFSFI